MQSSIFSKIGILLLPITYYLLPVLPVSAQTADNGDGTFTNPVIWTDMPDPDVTQVGDTFYMVNTSMHILPGVTIVKSHDLVNWEFAANVLPQFDNDPFFNLQGGNRYGKGQWATAIRYWGGQFHVLFTSNSNGCFIYSSPTMEGPWKKTTLYDGPYHPILDRFKPLDEQKMNDGFSHHILYDPGFLVDNDGRVYVVHGNSVNYITEIDPETCQAKGPARLLYKRHREGLEGNRPYHIGNYYYIICTYGGSHSGNVTCMRSRSLEGPWEEREVMRVGARRPEVNILQASLIPLKSGETWAMAFLDMDELGRSPHLVPVHWIDDWPVFGDFANGNITLPKPKVSSTSPVSCDQSQDKLATSDDFSSTKLGIQWQFNHNPDWTKVSLTKRQGWLRLFSQKANQPLAKKDAKNYLVRNDNPISKATIDVFASAPFLMARNILTQRLFGPRSIATAKIDVSNIKSGDCAGVGLLNIPYGLISISRTAKGFTLSQKTGDNEKEQSLGDVSLTSQQAKNLWLRVDAEATGGTATFAYSVDGEHFTSIGKMFQMVYSGSYFVGNRLALFCYNTKSDNGGWMDVDNFDVKIMPLFDHTIKVGTTLEAEWTDALWRAELCWIGGKNPEGRQVVSSVEDGAMIAFNRLQYADPVTKLTFTVCNIDSKNTFVEFTDAVTGEVLGTADIPTAIPSVSPEGKAPVPSVSTEGKYTPVTMTLAKPLVSNHRIEIRLWNHDWDQPHMGKILIDNIKFE